MTTEQIKAVHQAQPFQPFTIHLADGSTVPVKSPQFMWRTPSGRTIFASQGGEDVSIIDLLLVTRLTLGNGAQRNEGN